MNTSLLQELENKAVDAAIRADWKAAVDANIEILKKQKDHVSSLLRLGFAHLQLKEYTKSLEAYKKVLHLQPQNAIAGDYVEKIEFRRKQSRNGDISGLVLDPNMFVELPGKTKAVTLNQLGQKSTLAELTIGENLVLNIRKHHVEVRTKENEYVGVLPDDVGVRMMYFLENKSEYSAYVQESTLSNVIVFVREVSKGKKVERLVSFPVDIPGSIAKVMAQQQADEDQVVSRVATPEGDEEKSTDQTPDGEVIEAEGEKEDDDLEGELLKDLEGDQKPETEVLGIETDEEEEEE